MFQRLGHITAKYRIPIIVGWIALAAVLTLVAPDLDEVSSSDQKDFLPEDAPFVRAQEVQERVFPEQSSASTSMVLVDAGPGGNVHDAGVWAFIEKLEAWLNSASAPENVIQAVGPATAPEFADKLISPEGITSKNSAGMATSGYLVEVEKVSMARMEEWREQYPAAFEREYDPASGLRFNAWVV